MQGEFECSDGRDCIRNIFRCDGVAQCRDLSDEVGCGGGTGGEGEIKLVTYPSEQTIHEGKDKEGAIQPHY